MQHCALFYPTESNTFAIPARFAKEIIFPVSSQNSLLAILSRFAPLSARINGHAERDLSPKWPSDFYLLFLTTKRSRRGHVLCLKSSFAILTRQKTHNFLLLCVRSLPFNLYQTYCLSLLMHEICVTSVWKWSYRLTISVYSLHQKGLLYAWCSWIRAS